MIHASERNDMDLRTLFRELPARVVVADGSPAADGSGKLPAREIVDITIDSRNVVTDGLFLACQGARQHGLNFVSDALRAGVGAIAWEADGVSAPALPDTVTGVAVPELKARLGELANRFFARPSEALALVGITGTNGKTTTAWLVAEAIGHLGSRAGYLGTLGYGFSDQLQSAALTTPDCISFHRQLRAIVDGGGRHAIAEVSSHALSQDRVAGARFSTVAFTNLSRDHLDYYADLDSYGAAKARLFRLGAGHAVINLDDEFGRKLAAELVAGAKDTDTKFIGVSLRNVAGATLQGSLQSLSPEGIVVELNYGGNSAVLHSALWGRINAENLLLAAGILLAEGWSLVEAAGALSDCTAPPGRLQRVAGADDQPVVLVDFAHTPDALRKVLAAVREHCTGDIWCVFGCGGDRDPGKRALMGAAAIEGAAHVIVTDDNPRQEDPQQIIADILAGIANVNRVQVVPDRAAAIQRAIHLARAGDAVLIAGKGHEQVQITREGRRPFSDTEVASEALASARNRTGRDT
ncbi:MAG: UDP-N-acetylmuramoyl-L-alanyl-D-glutamate--2,6-diaminopimelate ligase [Gammaproteobacteria bacterium]